MAYFCIDIGNTHTHVGIVHPDRTEGQTSLSTPLVDHPVDGIIPTFLQLTSLHGPVEGIAFCSVVPAATPLLQRAFDLQKLSIPVFHLTHRARLGVPIHYPTPTEIGQDRLANTAAAASLGQGPAVVIDTGTAVTFDVITRSYGYEGGVIAPGIEIMRSYLHEKTAQLPKLDELLEVPHAVGRSTLEAMRIGTVIGFTGMVQALLDATLRELRQRGETDIRIYSTGGTAAFISPRLNPSPHYVPDLTLRGLAAAFRLNHA